MPNYDFICETESCSTIIEAVVRLADTDNPAKYPICPNCGGPTLKILSAPGISFRGHGWTPRNHGGRTQ